MSKSLTKNARWIVAYIEERRDPHVPLSGFTPIVFNCGRYPWEVTEMDAIVDAIDMEGCSLIQTYLIDVELYPYAKQHQYVTNIAKDYFRKKYGADYDKVKVDSVLKSKQTITNRNGGNDE